ncbi:translation initiation factor IF-2 [Parabacteroides sp. PFB2-12]|uniref:translation initiation factor IF-2 n=1 Tax=unclassified Parabacteroides TaxID=2649774 RepID=UPI00247563B9|nr:MULTISPECIES: translation initiation factor IF-2 [unclassified Parabacteroides]MDH6343131.1 translation initiation factor IF-2 [Parabacteroides sp. PM6-13]MDH6390775.1 translation initiation factor IF-2 [Parabacteroides sp. PFB2-12]
MPIKLIKVQRTLNVGKSTVVEFLHKRGHDIEDNPNTRISDEQYALLVKEFGKDLSESERMALLTEQSSPKEKPQSPRKEEKREEIKTVVPDEYRPKIVTKGHIDLEKKAQKEEVAEKPVVEEKPKVEAKPEEKPVAKPEPVATPPAAVVEEKKEEKKEAKKEPAKQEEIAKPEPPKAVVQEEIKEERKPEPEKKTTPVEPQQPKMEEVVETVAVEEDSSEPFRLNTPKIESNIKVKGHIDLTALNQSTRPKKKTKEERRKERDEKHKPAAGNRPGGQNPPRKEGDAKPGQGNQAGQKKPGEDPNAKKKRTRIKKDRVDINNTPGTNTRPSRPHGGASGGDSHHKSRVKRPVKAEVSEEDVQKQIKETLARLTNKGNKGKGAKYRRDKRDAAVRREHELMEQEEMDSRVLKLTEFVTANDLANMMNVPVTQVIATCMSIGIMVSINQRLDAETINIVADEFGFKTEYVSAEVVEAIKDDENDNEEDWVSRPPIVAVMGHVDHGKTSLLDNIRKANVIAGEAGGITQHIGAYNVKLASGGRITFLDTPGHEAFTAMRARGAKATDIAIIIVAADDSVMPQTVEAINHASAAGVPIVFAINKVDKPSANPEKIKEELANMNYLVEEWGGKYQSQDISAKKGQGVEELLEKVLLEADLLDLKANPTKRATGSIIESSLDKGRGYVSTVLVENGTLKMGDIVIAGTHYGRIKAMFNERNQRVEKAGPSEPVLILGLNGAPQAGDTFNVLETEQEAREIATRREQLQRELGLRTQKMLTLDDIGRRIAVGSFQELNVIVKGDVDGSVEALSDSLIRLSTEEIQVNVIHKAVGQISESDVVLAAASNAIIIGFQVRPSVAARRNAEKDGVEIRLYSIIYDAIEEVKSAMEGMLSPEIREEFAANVEVLQVFKITKVGTIAGCIVKEGKIKRTNKVRLIRDGIVVHTGELESLKRFKDEAKEVVSGQECGLNIKNFNDIQVGDIVEAYEETEIKKTL